MSENYIVQDDGSLVRIPFSVMDQLINKAARLPQYAGKRIRTAFVATADSEDGVPQEIVRIIGSYLSFDDDGRLNVDEIREAGAFKFNQVNFFGEAPAAEEVVDLQAQKNKREKERLYRWKPSPSELNAITAAALGHPKGVKNVKSVKTPAPKKIESWRAEKALDEMGVSVWKLNSEVDELSENDLTVLAELIEKRARERADTAEIWRGIKEVCLRNREIERLRRTGEGSWWAIVQMIKWTEPRNGECLHSWEEKCETREAAAARAREIARKNAELIDTNMTVEVRVYTDLEHEHGLDF